MAVIDPCYESIQLSRKIGEMGERIGKEVGFILNKIDDESEDLLKMVDRDKVVGVIPRRSDIFSASLRGEALPDTDIMSNIADKLLKT